MVFVPRVTRSQLAGISGLTADLSIPEPLLVDRFEVTHADLAHYRMRTELPWEREGDRTASSEHWPAPVTFREAEQLAERRGMRVLVPREWIHLAVGPRGHDYPWGPNFQASVANTLDLGLGRPAEVGTFERGKSQPYGCYDLLGNVWEWVDGVVPGFEDSKEDRAMQSFRGRRSSAMGGSFLSAPRETMSLGPAPTYHAMTLDVDHLASDLGVRLGVEARGWLLARAPEWGKDDRTRERLRAVGESWGRDALDFLQRLGAEPGAPALLVELLEGARRAAP